MGADDDEGQEGTPGDEGGQGGGDGGGSAFSAEQLATIREVVREALGGLGSGGDPGPGDGTKPGEDKPGGNPGGRLVDQEMFFENYVRRELEKVKSAEKVGSLEEQVKKIMERPPKRYRRITTAMWGRGDDE